jgi:hypothetical protein
MKPEDLIKLATSFRQLIADLFFNGQTPEWLTLIINIFLLLIFALLMIWGLLFVASQCIRIWKEQITPLYYDQAQRRRVRNRQRFAEYIRQEIRQLNNREDWKDYRFTELEAEVEAEGKRLRALPLPFLRSTRRGLRREETLSKALELSLERLILLEGDPGSGKSIALRHVTEKLAQRATQVKSINSIIPLYINLKRLVRPSGATINRELIEAFAKQELNRIQDRDVEQFLDDEFQTGMQEGTWLFLFDSFDELPEILSSVEADSTIRHYAQAIDDFLSGFNTCRGIIASRHFRGPKHLGWPLFRILPLESRRWELIRKAELDPALERELTQKLAIAPSEIQEMTKNPMFLGLLCEEMRAGSPFPTTTHSVFEHYLQTRLTRDADRLQKRFQLAPKAVRAAAERIAFCMTIDAGLGLNPTREKIRAAMERHQLACENFDGFMTALEYLKLARAERSGVPGDAEAFTFAHRRFQEYFATCIVLSDLTRISPQQLLTDGRWRETAVVILQTQSAAVLAPILTETNDLLQDMMQSIPDLTADPYALIQQPASKSRNTPLQPFAWPVGLLPLLSLLQDGLISRLQELPSDIQDKASRILLTASRNGTLADQKWSLEVAGITPQPVLLWLLRRAFASDSQWLKEVSFRQVARLGKIPDDLAAAIRKSVTRLFHQKRLNKEYLATHAHLSRLDDSSRFIDSLRLLSWIPTIDISLFVAVSIGFILLGSALSRPFMSLLIVPFGYTILYRMLAGIEPSLDRQSLFDYPLECVAGIYSVISRVVVFPLLWAPIAIIAADTGLFAKPAWWPFFLLLPAWYAFFNLGKTAQLIQKLFNYVYRIFTLNIATGLAGASILGLFIISIAEIFAIVPFGYASHALRVYSLVWSSWLLRTVIFDRDLRGECVHIMTKMFPLRDEARFREYSRQTHKKLTALEFLRLLELYQSPKYSKRLVTMIREKNLLEASNESEAVIGDLTLFLEWGLTSNDEKGTFPSSEIFEQWLERYIHRFQYRLERLGWEFLDETHRLLDQIRSAREKPDSPSHPL